MIDLRKIVDRVKPTFSKGGKLSCLHSAFDAFETFLFVPNTVTKKGVHIRDCNDMKRTMITVLVALMPALLFGMWNIGYQRLPMIGELGEVISRSIFDNFFFGFIEMLPIIIVSYAVGLGIEVVVAQYRKEEVNEGYFVTGMLVAMIVPIDTPLWMIALGVAFSVVFCKEIFGGTGMNIFNPALMVRMFIFFSYTASISGDAVYFADARTGATPLGQLGDTGMTDASMFDAFIGTIPGSIGETSTLCILLGAIVLVWTGVGSWRIILSVFLGGLTMGLIFNLLALENPDTATQLYMSYPAWKHLLLGGFAFGAVFMATDPVTAAQTNTGKWIVGFMIGLLAILVRVVNVGYPEGMMLAIIFMNAFSPLVDYYVVQANINRRLRRLKTINN